MSDQLSIVVGTLPWLPSPDARLLHVIHEYDRPLLAIIEQGGTQFMARCVLGEIGPDSVWVYSRLDEVTEGVLLTEGSEAQIDATADDLCTGEVLAAIVSEDRIRYASGSNMGDDEDWDVRLLQLMRGLEQSVHRLSSEVEHLTEKMLAG